MIFNDGTRKIKFNDDIINTIKGFRQLEPSSAESGGLLLGRENLSNNNLVVDNMTAPMPKDKRSRYRFVRKDKEHLNFFNEQYELSDGTIRYIGEWHTHPEDIPSYSSIDLKNWEEISGKSNVEDIYYHLIAGRTGLGVWMYSNKMDRPELLIKTNWENYEKN